MCLLCLCVCVCTHAHTRAFSGHTCHATDYDRVAVCRPVGVRMCVRVSTNWESACENVRVCGCVTEL